MGRLTDLPATRCRDCAAEVQLPPDEMMALMLADPPARLGDDRDVTLELTRVGACPRCGGGRLLVDLRSQA